MKLNNKLETNVEKDLLYFKYNTSDRLSTVSDHLLHIQSQILILLMIEDH